MSSDISFNPGMHNQEVADEQPTSGTQENRSELEALREPQDHSPASLWPSIDQQLSSSIDSLGIPEGGGQQRESDGHSTPLHLKDLPPEIREEIAKHLPRKALRNLSQVNQSLRNQFKQTVQDSQDKSNDIRDGAAAARLRPILSSEFDAQMRKISLQRPADQPEDLKNFIIRDVKSFALPGQAVQLWSQLSKHPIDQKSEEAITKLSHARLPDEKRSEIVNGLLDQIEKQSGEGTMPARENMPPGGTTTYHPLQAAAMMAREMPPKERHVAAERIRTIAESQNLTPSDSRLINLYVGLIGNG